MAIWGEIKKALNSDFLNEPLDAKTNRIEINTVVNNTASITGTLSQKLAYIISTLIGATNATGGTSTAGTAMAKLNAMLTSWTSTRAGYVDTINTNTATNNTASKTGILSQKASAIINKREASLTGVGITAFSGVTTKMYPQNYYCIAKFIALIDGVYTCTIGTIGPGTLYFYKVDDFDFSGIHANNSSYAPSFYGRKISQQDSYNLSSVGVESKAGVCRADSSSPFYWSEQIYKFLRHSRDNMNNWGAEILASLLTFAGIYQAPTTGSYVFNINCRAGEAVQLVGYVTGNTVDVNPTVTYQPEY